MSKRNRLGQYNSPAIGFDLGADLATPPGGPHEAKTRRMTEADVAVVEGRIDEFDDANTPLIEFILPGGTELAARLHVARTEARIGIEEILARGPEYEIFRDRAEPYQNEFVKGLAKLPIQF